MSRERRADRGAANRADDGGTDDPDSTAGPSAPGGWTPWSGGWELGWLPGARRDGERDDGRLYAVVILVGAGLFLFPEPVTTVGGLVLLVLGTAGLLFHLPRRRSP